MRLILKIMQIPLTQCQQFSCTNLFLEIYNSTYFCSCIIRTKSNAWDYKLLLEHPSFVLLWIRFLGQIDPHTSALLRPNCIFAGIDVIRPPTQPIPARELSNSATDLVQVLPFASQPPTRNWISRRHYRLSWMSPGHGSPAQIRRIH